MNVTLLAGGVGGARFIRGLAAALTQSPGDHSITVIGNTGDDITLYGLRVCPDLDTLLYTLGGAVHEGQGWGRAEESYATQGELSAYGVAPDWFRVGDLDLGTHVARSLWLGQGWTLSEVTARLAARWGLPGRGITVLPMTDSPVETHVVIDEGEGPRAVHFQEWWVRRHAEVPAQRFVIVGIDRAQPAPGVLDAITQADLLVLPPSNPVVSVGVILGVPGIREALRDAGAPVVGVSPIVGGRPVRGYADACLAALGLPATPQAVAGLYADFLDGWLVAPGDLPADGTGYAESLTVRSTPLLMTDLPAATHLGAAALELGRDLRAAR